MFLHLNPALHKAVVVPGHVKTTTIGEHRASMPLPRMVILQIQAPFESAKQDTPKIHQWKVMLDALRTSGNTGHVRALSGKFDCNNSKSSETKAVNEFIVLL